MHYPTVPVSAGGFNGLSSGNTQFLFAATVLAAPKLNGSGTTPWARVRGWQKSCANWNCIVADGLRRAAASFLASRDKLRSIAPHRKSGGPHADS